MENQSYIIEKTHNDGRFLFTGRWKYGTVAIFSSDRTEAHKFNSKAEAEEFNTEQELLGTVVENVCIH